MPSSQGEFATCLTMSINRGELRALEVRHSWTGKFDGEFGQGTQSYSLCGISQDQPFLPGLTLEATDGLLMRG